jgi:hypothetical protein
MITQAQICNLALAKLGDVARVVSIDPPDGSMQGNYCAIFYPQALSVLLSKHAWSFATQTVALAQATTNNNPLWNYAFILPTDYYDLIELRAGAGAPAVLSPYLTQTPFNPDQCMEYEIQAGVLYCNDATAVLIYISANYITEGYFLPLFVEALAVLLSGYLAGPLLKGDVGVAAQNKQMQLFTLALRLAVEADCKYRRGMARNAPSGIRARS